MAYQILEKIDSEWARKLIPASEEIYSMVHWRDWSVNHDNSVSIYYESRANGSVERKPH